MVKKMLMEEIPVEELDEYNEDCYLFIKFKPTDEFGRIFYMVDKDSGIGVLRDNLYVFKDNDLDFRARLEDIDFVFAYDTWEE